MKFVDKIFPVVFSTIFIFSLTTDWYRILVIALFVLLLFLSLEKLGRGIIMRELISLHMSFVCLFMPMIGYIYYNQNNSLASTWIRYMLIDEQDYFSFALPAVAAFSGILCAPFFDTKINDFTSGISPLLLRARKILMFNPWAGSFLLVFGIVMFSFSASLPIQLQFAFALFYFAAFAGFLYVFYQPAFKFRNLVLFAFASYIIAQSLSSGMFTIIAYMGITMSSFFFIGKAVSMWKKISFLAIGIFLLFIIQSIKSEYRNYIWKQNFEGNRAVLYTDLLINRITTLSEIDGIKLFFPIYYRTNQGFNISQVMRRFPSMVEFDEGRKLMVGVISSFVPRFLWADKPKAGGKENMLYYAGINIETFSTNVGPLGEAYASFGRIGGIIFMFILAFFIRWAYHLVFVVSQKYPLILFWIPVLFFQTSYSAEADTLQILNSLIKSTVFIWILFRVLPILFGKNIEKQITPN